MKYSAARIAPFVIFTFLALTQSCAQSPDGYEFIDIATFDSLRMDSTYIVIDVRSPEETAKGKIEGAMEIDWFGDDFNEKIDALDPEAKYLLYCRSGNRSGKSARKMAEKGFKHLYNLNGGYNKWKEAHRE